MTRRRKPSPPASHIHPPPHCTIADVLASKELGHCRKGPWSDEPNEVIWTTESGLPGKICRNLHLLHLCGYVRVPRDHPGYGRDLIDFDSLEVHGGVTFAEDIIPGVGEKDPDHWWIGFDCAHAMDIVPGLDRFIPGRPKSWAWQTYRDIAYVRAEVESLAKQLAAMPLAKGDTP